MDPPEVPPPGPVDVVCNVDGASAAREAIARAGAHRTAVWVGPASDPAVEDFRAEIGHSGG